MLSLKGTNRYKQTLLVACLHQRCYWVRLCTAKNWGLSDVDFHHCDLLGAGRSEGTPTHAALARIQSVKLYQTCQYCVESLIVG